MKILHQMIYYVYGNIRNVLLVYDLIVSVLNSLLRNMVVKKEFLFDFG